MSDPRKHYDGIAKALHGLMALLIIGLLLLGWSMGEVEDTALKFELYQYHKSFGLTVLVLSVVRVLWRVTHRFPDAPSSLGGLVRGLAKVGHGGLYILMLAMPLSGWVLVSTSAFKFPTLFFGLFVWPSLPFSSNDVGALKAVNMAAAEAHETLAAFFALLIVGHVAAALYHHFIHRDDVLLRMMPTWLSPLLNKLRGF